LLRRTVLAGLVAAAASALVLPVPGTHAAGGGPPKLTFDTPPAFVKAGGSVRLGGVLTDGSGAPVRKNPVQVGTKAPDGTWSWGKNLTTDAKGRFSISIKANTDPDRYRLVATTISSAGDVDSASEFLPWVPVTFPIAVKVGKVPEDGGLIPVAVSSAECEGALIQLELKRSGGTAFEPVDETESCSKGVASFVLPNPGAGKHELRAVRPQASEMTTASTSRSAKLTIKAPKPASS
jgi:hypothetical protein